MPRTDRRDFIKSSIGTAAAAALTARASVGAQTTGLSRPARIRFAAIGINHDHINSQVESVKRGGGEFTEDDEAAWLSPDETEAGFLLSMLRPVPDDLLHIHRWRGCRAETFMDMWTPPP